MRRSSQNVNATGSPGAWQENTINTRRRLAAGLCVLSLVLLFGGFGETVATADSETGDSVSDAGGSIGDAAGSISGTEGSVSGTAGTAETEPPSGGTVGTGFPDTYGDLGSSATESHSTPEPGDNYEASGGLTGPMALGASTDDAAGGATAAVEEDNNGSDSTPAAATEEANEPEVVVSYSPVTEPSPEPEAPDAGVTALTNDHPAEEPTAVQPVTNEVASVDDSTTSVQAEATPTVGGAAAPATNVITALAHLFIALTDDNVPFIKLPDGLLSLVGFPLTGDGATASPTAGGIGGSLVAGDPYPAGRTQLPSTRAVQAGWPEMLIALGDSAASPPAGVVAHPTLGGVGASGAVEQHSVGIKAVLADGVVPEKVRSVLQHTVDAVLAPLSVLALAALASPGVSGLLLLSAAGMFVGYRQARAASMLRAVGIARFAKSGPLGVVRSGSLIAVHPRPSRAVRPQPSRTSGLLEPVA